MKTKLKSKKYNTWQQIFSQLGWFCLFLTVINPIYASETVYQSENSGIRLVRVVEGLEHPWSMAFLPSGDVLVTERPGHLRLVEQNQSADDDAEQQTYQLHPDPIAGLPDITPHGQGGLLDVILHPNFAKTQWIYLSYVDKANSGYTTRVLRAKLDLASHQLVDVMPIFEALPRSNRGQHFGSRLLFDNAGYLYITIGDRGERDRAQDGLDHAGSVVRLTENGTIPPDNPFIGNDKVLDEIYTWGHRNPQGMALHPETGDVWVHEHGPRGGDEINRLIAGSNYGWPKATFGINYIGTTITKHTELPDMVSPLFHWTPSIAPSGMVFYTGEVFPAWQGDLFVGALSYELVARLEFAKDKDSYQITEADRLLTDFNRRIRDIRQSPSGELWLLTDQRNGGLYRMLPIDRGSAVQSEAQ